MGQLVFLSVVLLLCSGSVVSSSLANPEANAVGMSNRAPVVHLEMRGKRITLTASEKGIFYSITTTDDRSTPVAESLSVGEFAERYPALHELVKKAIAKREIFWTGF